MILRDPRPDDEAAWRALWVGYLAFYEQALPESVTSETWRRILDPGSPVLARVAEGQGGALLGLCHCVLHEGTWTSAPICYLEDLFVEADARGHGVGHALIEDALGRARINGWSRLYWHTRADNAAARHLYDRFAQADGFVRYRLFFD